MEGRHRASAELLMLTFLVITSVLNPFVFGISEVEYCWLSFDLWWCHTFTCGSCDSYQSQHVKTQDVKLCMWMSIIGGISVCLLGHACSKINSLFPRKSHVIEHPLFYLAAQPPVHSENSSTPIPFACHWHLLSQNSCPDAMTFPCSTWDRPTPCLCLSALAFLVS